MLKAFEAQDWDAYFAMGKDFYASEACDHPVPDDNFRHTFAEILRFPERTKGWLVWQNELPVGYFLASIMWSPEFGGLIAWLEEFYLRPEVRGKGLGRSVFETIMRKLQDEDKVIGFRLEVAPANESVSQLYQKLGFTKVPYHQWWMAAE